jgi:hypothetical protein
MPGILTPRARGGIARRASYIRTFAGGSSTPEEREFRAYLSKAGGVAQTRLQELTGEVRDMQKLYEHIALGLSRMLTISREDLQREEGQGAVEYALTVLGIAAIISLAVAGFATQITSFMTAAGGALMGFLP